MITISLCLIVKNEEDTLGRCLASVAEAVDEIIVVDTGSVDKTKQIAESHQAKVYDFAWIDDFAAARNFAFSQGTMEYLMWLDADDVLTEENCRKLQQLKATIDPSVDSVTMDYLLAKDHNGNVISSLRRNRLVKASRQFKWIGAVHEYLEVSGNIFNSDMAVEHRSIHHDSDRNLHIYLKKLSRGDTFSPRDVYYFANELLDHRMFDLAVVYYEKFIDSGKGWVEDVISACGKLADCYHNTGNKEKEIESALRALQYDSPRPEFSCRLGYYFFERKQYGQAVYWYTQATQWQRPANHWGKVSPSCSTWLPHLQLCVCYDRLGQFELANRHNEMAAQYRPDSAAIIGNRAYFQTKLNRQD